jgi:hypothetical protein
MSNIHEYIILDLMATFEYFATINSSKKRFLKNLTIELNISGFSSYNRYGFILQIDCKFSFAFWAFYVNLMVLYNKYFSFCQSR